MVVAWTHRKSQLTNVLCLVEGIKESQTSIESKVEQLCISRQEQRDEPVPEQSKLEAAELENRLMREAAELESRFQLQAAELENKVKLEAAELEGRIKMTTCSQIRRALEMVKQVRFKYFISRG